MSSTPRSADHTATEDRINSLYWHSDQPVVDIAEQLGLGRNSLYAAVEPISAGAICDDCGEEMVFTNRTNRQNGTATCRGCGIEREVTPGGDTPPDPIRGAAGGDGLMGRTDVNGDARSIDRLRHELATVDPERYALVGGAAALGVMVGAAAARALRDRM